MAAESLPELETGRLLGRTAVGGGLVLHRLAVSAEKAATYRTPGQYVSLSLSGNKTYFALAGEPQGAPWEVLVRPGGDVADELLGLAEGSTVALSRALGDGFPMSEARARRLFVLVTGSGLAAVRAVLRARVREGLAASTELLLGVRTVGDIPLASELAQLGADGIGVTVCCSQGGVGHADVSTGYVQDVLERRVVERSLDLTGAILFAAGTTAMIEQLRALARNLRVDEADVRTNY